MSDLREALWEIANLCMASRMQSKRTVHIHVTAMKALGLTESQRIERLEKSADRANSLFSMRRDRIVANAIDAPPHVPMAAPESSDFVHPSTYLALETVDAMLFSGDPQEPERKGVRWYAVRWQRRLKVLSEIADENVAE